MKPRSPRSTLVCAALPSVAALLAAGVTFAPAAVAQNNRPRGGIRHIEPRPPVPPAAPTTPPVAPNTPPSTPPVAPHTPPVVPPAHARPRPPDHPVNVRGGEGKVSLMPVTDRNPRAV